MKTQFVILLLSCQVLLLVRSELPDSQNDRDDGDPEKDNKDIEGIKHSETESLYDKSQAIKHASDCNGDSLKIANHINPHDSSKFHGDESYPHEKSSKSVNIEQLQGESVNIEQLQGKFTLQLFNIN